MAATTGDKVFDESVGDDAVLEKFGYEQGKHSHCQHLQQYLMANRAQENIWRGRDDWIQLQHCHLLDRPFRRSHRRRRIRRTTRHDLVLGGGLRRFSGRSLFYGRNVQHVSCGRWTVLLGGHSGPEEVGAGPVLCLWLVYVDRERPVPFSDSTSNAIQGILAMGAVNNFIGRLHPGHPTKQMQLTCTYQPGTSSSEWQTSLTQTSRLSGGMPSSSPT